jgi:predicted enzyme related to lactoylglutathione lyase
MLKSPRIGAVFFYVSDLDRTEAFYRDVIGLSLQKQPDDGSGRPWLIASIEGNVDLLFFNGDVRTGNSPILVFNLESGGIDAVMADLAAAGTTIVTPVSHAPGGWSADFADPDGYTFSFYQTEGVPR